jgi:hypothetical protein
METNNSYEIMASVNEAYQNGEITEEKRQEIIDAELKFLKTGEY